MSATVLGGFWPEYGVSTLATAHNSSALKKRIAKLMNREQMRSIQEIGLELMGVAISGTPTAAATKGRISTLFPT